MKITLVLAILPLLMGTAFAHPTEMADTLRDFCNRECYRAAAMTLRSYQERAVPPLIHLLQVDREDARDWSSGSVVLCFGSDHSGDVYDLSKLQSRTGWLLEELTFQDFGFSDHGDNAHRVPLSRAGRQAAVERARRWWRKQPENWQRIDGLCQALQSERPREVGKALRYLAFANPRGPCDSLTRATYYARLHPILQRHRRSQDLEICRLATLIWLRAEAEKAGSRDWVVPSGTKEISEATVYRWRADQMLHNLAVVARIGDPLEVLPSEFLQESRPSSGEVVWLSTNPQTSLLVKNGRIKAFRPIDPSPLPWHPVESAKE